MVVMYTNDLDMLGGLVILILTFVFAGPHLGLIMLLCTGCILFGRWSKS